MTLQPSASESLECLLQNMTPKSLRQKTKALTPAPGDATASVDNITVWSSAKVSLTAKKHDKVSSNTVNLEAQFASPMLRNSNHQKMLLTSRSKGSVLATTPSGTNHTKPNSCSTNTPIHTKQVYARITSGTSPLDDRNLHSKNVFPEDINHPINDRLNDGGSSTYITTSPFAGGKMQSPNWLASLDDDVTDARYRHFILYLLTCCYYFFAYIHSFMLLDDE